MKILRRAWPLLLLVLPPVVVALQGSAAAEDLDPITGQETVDPVEQYAEDAASKHKIDVGTKDAPVDGKDGKPHDGPYISSDANAKKEKPVSSIGETLDEAKGDEVALPDDDTPAITNDGSVMDDPHRKPPKKGTTGTEGGVSEKTKNNKLKESKTGKKIEKVPDAPKETSSETVKADYGSSNIADSQDPSSPGVESTPALAELGDSIKSKSRKKKKPPKEKTATKSHLDNLEATKQKLQGATDDLLADGLIQPLHSFVLSMTMILVSEIGDKTFLIAALMAMKHPRLQVFSAAFAALIFMTILSAVLGHAVPTLIPKKFTNFMAAALFLVFGIRMLREGLAMSPSEGVAAEMQEVEQELAEKEVSAQKRRSSVSPYNLEMGIGRDTRKSRSGSRLPNIPRSPSTSPERSPSPSRHSLKNTMGGLTNLLSLLLSPAWVQTFAMTFLGEWGDRSQIATIAMAAGQDYWWVTGGAVSGHAVCTGVAVLGGRAIAGKVSLRVVTLGGAIAFLAFGFIYLVEALYYGS